MVLALGAPAAAQVQSQTDKLYIGSGMAPTLDPFIVQSMPAVTAGPGSSNALAIDGNGAVRRDAGTSVDTSGHWFFGNWLYGPMTVATSAGQDSALGFTNFRIHQNAGTPRVTWEYAGSQQWSIDNLSGQMRFYRTSSAGIADQVPLQIDGNINVAPYGKYILPVNPYETSLGSVLKKFAALWVADLFAETLVATDAIGTTGNHWLIGSTNILDEDITSSSTTIITRYNNFTVNDHIYFMARLRTEFMKITAGPTLLNKITNPDFETGSSPTWDVSTGDSVAYSTAKTFHGDKSILVTHGGSSVLQVAQQGAQFSALASTAYTFCGYFRRVDGAVVAPGDIQVKVGDGTFVDMTAENTGTDAWYRMCATATSASSPSDFRAPFLNFTTNNSASTVDWYLDSFQLEPGSSVRQWSPTRSSYTVTRDEDGGGPNPWATGDAAFDTGGAAGYGWLDCYSLFGMKSTAEVGPSCVALVRTGTAFNAWEPYAGWGNLNGNWGYGANTFGFVAGPLSGLRVMVDNLNGIRFFQGGTEKSRWDLATGNIQIGDFTANHPVMLLTSTTLQFCVYGGPCTFTVDGTTGDMHGGSATALNTGAGYFLGGTGTFRFGNPSGNRVKWDNTNVEIVSQNLTINQNGASIATTTCCYDPVRAYAFGRNTTGSSSTFGLGAYDNGTTSALILSDQVNNGSSNTQIALTVGNNGTPLQYINLISGSATGQTIDIVTSGSLTINGTPGVTKTCTVLPTVVKGLITSC